MRKKPFLTILILGVLIVMVVQIINLSQGNKFPKQLTKTILIVTIIVGGLFELISRIARRTKNNAS
jgi:hypothetical protein